MSATIPVVIDVRVVVVVVFLTEDVAPDLVAMTTSVFGAGLDFMALCQPPPPPLLLVFVVFFFFFLATAAAASSGLVEELILVVG